MELLGQEPAKTYMNYHWKDSLGTMQQDQSAFSLADTDFSADYHTFAVDWEPDSISWYVDGVLQKTFTNAPVIISKPMYLIANTQVGGPSSWPGAPDGTTAFPTDYSIDYIRVWQRSASPTETPAPTLTPTAMPSETPSPTVQPSFTPTPTSSLTPAPTAIPTTVLTPGPTVTVVPTTIPTPNSNLTPTPTAGGVASSGSNSAPTCNNARPVGLSDLFQINVRDTTAQLFFTPVSRASEFAISYGTQPSAEIYGARISVGQTGVQTVTIGELQPSTVYYFKVRGQNGCMPGDWSNTLRVVTRSKNTTKTTIFYRGGQPIGSALIGAVRQLSQSSAAPAPIKGAVQNEDYSLLPSVIPTLTSTETATVNPPLLTPTPVVIVNRVPVTKQPWFWLKVLIALLLLAYLLKRILFKRDS
jgi:hypothetical protein